MKISKFRKYVTWNVISIIGYIGIIISVVFFFMLFIASSGLVISFDISKYFYNYIINHVIIPYFEIYKIQLIVITLLAIMSVYENGYYIQNNEYGLRIFTSTEEYYIFFFVIGLFLNFLPMYFLSPMLISWYSRLFF